VLPQFLLRRRTDEEVPLSDEYLLIAFSSPAEGRDAEYHSWYDDVHLPEFTALPGVTSGRRYTVSTPGGGDAAAKPAFAAVYELSEEPSAVLAAMRKGIKDGTIHLTDVVDNSSASMYYLKAR
jgi:hypothetical protein